MTRDTAAPQGSALGAIHALLGIIRGSSGRRRLTILAMGLVVIIVATALAQLRLNTWQRDFYDALAQRNFPAFLQQLGVFAIIAGILLLLNVSQN